ncbi:MAG: hypothetical protein U5L96_04520 [Owenweeksia sp.]|nr:hypothetical protein [Owenweeksia sp.]
MSSPSLCPRYRFTTNQSADVIRSAVRRLLKDKEKNQLGLQQRSVSNHLILVFPRKQKHFWSPTMDVNFEKTPHGKTKVRMLLGPEPSIWTMFVFFYTIGGLMAAVGIVLGSSQYILGHNSWYFLLIPAGLVIIGAFYLAALVGKGRASEQMYILKNFMEEAMGEPIFHEEETNATIA